MREYLVIIFCGIAATFLYNYFASFLRAVGNSVVPLIFLAVSAVLNTLLDLWFVLGLERGVAGAAEATVIAQYVSGVGIAVYALARCPQLRAIHKGCRIRWACVREIAGFSILTCVQQSVMNLGILMVQGLVNSFGPTVMAAFAAAVKIDAFAICPCRTSATPFPPSLPKTTAPRRKPHPRWIERGCGRFHAFLCGGIRLGVGLCRPLMALFVEAGETEIILEASAICASKAPFTAGSAACSCCTAYTGAR